MGKSKRHVGQAGVEQAESTGQHRAVIVSSFGRHFLARDCADKMWQVFGKGKRREVAVGDEVVISPSGGEQAWIEDICPRRNLMYRSDQLKSKLFAANIDLVLLVLSISPPYSSELLGRTLVACLHAGVPLHIVFNKVDLLADCPPDVQESIHKDLQSWTSGLCDITYISATASPQQTIATLSPLLKNKRTLILGQSGMGKSTLLNLLVPDALARTNEVSMALNAGKHTTTHTQLHLGPTGMELIDSPGFQAFGLHHLSFDELLAAFTDIAKLAQQCRFANCHHRQEPGCAVKAARDDGGLNENRWVLFEQLKTELETKPSY